MVCEACEFVDTFLKLYPDTSVILNIDCDHLDYFKTMDNLRLSFTKFCNLTTERIIYNGDDENTVIAVNNSAFDPNAAYQPVVKGNAAAANLEGFAYTAVNAMQQAAVTFTSQNVGAAKYGRVKRVMACCYGLGIAVGLTVTVILVGLQEPLLALYGVKDMGDELSRAAVEAGKARILWTLLPYALIALMEVGSGTLRGLGKSLTSTCICMLFACVLRVVWRFTIFNIDPASISNSLASIYISYPVSWVLAGLFLFVFSALNLHHLIRTYKENHNEL